MLKPASDELLKLAQEMLPKRYIFRPSVYEVNELVIEDLNLRVFPTQKISGGFGVTFYTKNKENPVSNPYVRHSPFTSDYPSFCKALEEGLKLALLYLKNETTPEENY